MKGHCSLYHAANHHSCNIAMVDVCPFRAARGRRAQPPPRGPTPAHSPELTADQPSFECRSDVLLTVHGVKKNSLLKSLVATRRLVSLIRM